MEDYKLSKYPTFYAIGLSYHKADADIRGRFSLNEDQQKYFLKDACENGHDGVLITSTCNRTEVYGFAQHPYQLIKLLCHYTEGDVEELEKVAYIYKNNHAVNHMFKVGTGLDSQILGDFEIIAQLKNAFKRSKKANVDNHFLERLLNSIIQASKKIKNETNISSGATSVSFASAQYMLEHVENISKKKIVLFGTGKIGRNTCENLVKHTANDQITLINRTREKAEKIAGKFNLIVHDYKDLQREIDSADILIVATGAQQPTVLKNMVEAHPGLLILDLSIPRNVDPEVEKLTNVKLIHLDYLSQLTDATLERRKSELPKAEDIIETVQDEFNEWLETRKFVPTIKALKGKLKEMKENELDFQSKKIDGFNQEQAEIISDRMIQKIMNKFAKHLRTDADDSDQSLELIQKVFSLDKIQK
jgi:glutamyl-tRNA reductase